MNDADRTALASRIRRNVENARARGLHVWGYELRPDGGLSLWTVPAATHRRQASLTHDPDGLDWGSPRSSRRSPRDSQGRLL